MGKLTYSAKLLRELTAFAKANKVYWIVPLVIVLALAALIAVAGQGAAPFITRCSRRSLRVHGLHGTESPCARSR